MTRPAVLALAAALAAAAGAARAQAPDPEAEAPAPGDGAPAAEGEASGAGDEAASDDLPLSVTPTLGLGGLLPAGDFAPVYVDLRREQAGPPLRTQVTVLSSGGGNVLLELGPVEVGAEGRRLQGFVPVRALLEAGGLVVRARGDDDGRLLGEAEADATASPARILAVIDRRGAAPADLTGLRTGDPSAPPNQPSDERWAAAIVSRHEALPTSPLGYGRVGAVLLGDLDPAAWEEPQARALAAWVARGGHLVVSVGPRASALRRSLIGEQLGGGLAPLPDREPGWGATIEGALDELAAAEGLDAPTGAATAPALARLLPGDDDEVVLRDDAGRPFVLRRDHGQGRVTLIAADLWTPPLLYSPVTVPLLARVLADGPVHAPRSQVIFPELAAVRQPARVGPAFAILIFYALIAGPGVYFVLRARRRTLLLWLAIPALTVAFTLLVPLYRLALKDAESTLVGVRLVEARSGDALALETTDVLLFSGSLEDKRLDYTGGDPVAYNMIPSRGRGAAPRLGRVLGSAARTLEVDLPVALWGTRYVSFESSGEAPPITGSVDLNLVRGRRAGHGATVRLDYAGGSPLDDAIVVYHGPTGALVHRLPEEIAPGESLVHEQKVTSIATDYGAGEDLEGLMLERLIDAYAEEVERRKEVAYLLALSNDAIPLRALPNVRTSAFAHIVAVELPVRYTDGVPFGVADVEREAATIADVSSSTVEREVVTRFRLPPGPARPVHELRLRVSARRATTVARLELEVWAADAGAWEPVPLETMPGDPRDHTGRMLVAVFGDPEAARAPPPAEGEPAPDPGDRPDPSRWLEVEGERRAVTFRQRFARPRTEADGAYTPRLELQLEWAD